VACGGARSTRRPISTARAPSAPRPRVRRVSRTHPSSLSTPTPRELPKRAPTPHENSRYLRRRGAPLVLISGLNVLESLDVALACADGSRGDRGTPRPAGGVQGLVRQGQPLEPRLVPRRGTRRGPAHPRAREGGVGSARDHRRARARPGEARRRSGRAAPDPRVPLAPDRSGEGVRGDRALRSTSRRASSWRPNDVVARRREGEGLRPPAV